MPRDTSRLNMSVDFQPVNIAVMTISDSRTADTDRSGDLLASRISEDGHVLAGREIITDDVARIMAQLRTWIDDPQVDAVITTGGTGLTGRDSTPEAFAHIVEKDIPGFGELFRQLSYDDIGTSTIQSRALGGLANGTLIFSLPGSSGAVTLGWEKILHNQLDINFRPCNFAELIPRFLER